MAYVYDRVQVKFYNGARFDMYEASVSLDAFNLTLDERVRRAYIAKVLENSDIMADDPGYLSDIYAYRFVRREMFSGYSSLGILCNFNSDMLEKTSWTYIGKEYSLDQVRAEQPQNERLIEAMEEYELNYQKPAKAIKLKEGIFIVPDEAEFEVREEPFEDPW